MSSPSTPNLASALSLGAALLRELRTPRPGSPRGTSPQRLLFWSSAHRPEDHQHPEVPWDRRTAAAAILERPAQTIPYLGWAECRLCGKRLGSRDFLDRGFVWPEGAEHYVLYHEVWTPGLDALLRDSGSP